MGRGIKEYTTRLWGNKSMHIKIICFLKQKNQDKSSISRQICLVLISSSYQPAGALSVQINTLTHTSVHVEVSFIHPACNKNT